MANEIMSYEEFNGLDTDEKIKTIKDYKKHFSNSEIMRKWGLSDYEFYTKLQKKQLGIGRATRSRQPSKKAESQPKTTKQNYVKSLASLEKEEETREEGMKVKINGIYNAEKLQNKLEKLALLTEEGTNYSIQLTVEEKL